MIKIVTFDLGNVILPFDLRRLASRLSAHSPFTPDEIIKKLWNDHVADHFETGKMSPEEYFNHVTAVCQFENLSFEEFIPIFNDIFDQNHDVVRLIETLRKRYKLGLISNTNAIHADHIKDEYDQLNYFDHRVFSNEAGVRKPHADIYKMILEHFNVEPHEMVFIDDMPINIEGAEALGIKGIHFKNSKQLHTDLKQMGVEIQ